MRKGKYRKSVYGANELDVLMSVRREGGELSLTFTPHGKSDLEKIRELLGKPFLEAQEAGEKGFTRGACVSWLKPLWAEESP